MNKIKKILFGVSFLCFLFLITCKSYAFNNDFLLEDTNLKEVVKSIVEENNNQLERLLDKHIITQETYDNIKITTDTLETKLGVKSDGKLASSKIKTYLSYTYDSTYDNEKDYPNYAEIFSELIGGLDKSGNKITTPSVRLFDTNDGILDSLINYKFYILDPEKIGNLTVSEIAAYASNFQKEKEKGNYATFQEVKKYCKEISVPKTENEKIYKATIESSTQNTIGYSRNLTTEDKGNPLVGQIHLIELNKNAIDNIIQISDNISKNYMQLNNEVILMKYPLYYVSGVKIEDDKWKCVPQKSNMYINFMSGTLENENGTKLEIGDKDGTIEYQMYNFERNENEKNRKEESFQILDYSILEGIDGETKKFPILEKSNNVKDYYNSSYPVFMLRDYFEMRYSPNTASDNDNVVSTGRRFRITTFEGTTPITVNTTFGYLLNKNSFAPTTNAVSLTDIAGNAVYDKYKKLEYRNNSTENEILVTPSGLEEETTQEIIIGKELYQLQSFGTTGYGIVLTDDTINNGLKNDWINSGEGYFDAWNDISYRYFNYHIDKEMFLGNLDGIIAPYGETTDGKFIANALIINKINNDILTERWGGIVSNIYTIIKIIGWILALTGAAVLLLCMLDTFFTSANPQNGLLYKASFGKLAAVDKETLTALKEMQYENSINKGCVYITIKWAFIRFLILIAAAIILTISNPIVIIINIIKLISKVISKL